MKTKFAMPTERDLRFVRHSGFKPEEFGEDLRIVTSAIDGLLIGCGLIGLLSVLAIFGV